MRDWWRLLTARGRAALSAGVVLVVSGLGLGQVDLTRAGALALSLLALTRLWLARHSLDVAVARTVEPTRVSVEDVAAVHLGVRNLSTRGTPVLRLEESLPLELGDRPRFLLPRLPAGEQARARYTVRPTRRGVHVLGPLHVRVQDAFGLTLRLARVDEQHHLVVLPKVHPLPGAAVLGRGLSTEGARSHTLALHGEDDQSVRDYRDGDDRRRIHWPATARTGAVMVRQEDRPAHPRALVLLDCRSSAHPGGEIRPTLEWAVTMAASVTAHLVQSGYAVRLVVPASGAEECREEREVPSALDALARVRPASDQAYADALRRSVAGVAAGGLLVVVAGALSPADALGLQPLAVRGVRLLALTVTPHEPDEAVLDRLRAKGWSVTHARPTEPFAPCWQRATGRAAQGLGARS